MNDREKVIDIVEKLPENKLIYVLTYLQGLSDGMADDPNDDTIEALEETEDAIQTGDITPFTGSTKDFLDTILEG